LKQNPNNKADNASHKIATWKVIQKHLGFKVLGFRVPTGEPMHTHFQLTITIYCEQKNIFEVRLEYV
jgi:hypothetical protein